MGSAKGQRAVCNFVPTTPVRPLLQIQIPLRGCIVGPPVALFIVLMLITRFIALLLLACTPAAPVAAQTFFGPARVIDCDTIVVDSAKIRLHGIDARDFNIRSFGAGLLLRDLLN